MHQVFIGLTALTTVAVLVGSTVHWAAGVAVIALPILATYARLKLLPGYRRTCDCWLESATSKNS